MIIDLGYLELVIELRKKHKHLSAHLIQTIRPRNFIKDASMTVSANINDVSEVLFPVTLFDQDGEPLAIPDGAVVLPGTSDNTEVGIPSASVAPDPVGLLVKSVGDDQPNVGVATITGNSLSMPDGSTIPLENVIITVGNSAVGNAGLGGEPIIRART